MKNITVIGAGTMGNGIAHVFAHNGYHVQLYDINEAALENALATVSKNMDRQIAKDKLTTQEKEAALGRLQTGTNLKQALASANLVVEAATENKALKFKIFKELDEWAPAECILASNTSSITGTSSLVSSSMNLLGTHSEPCLCSTSIPFITNPMDVEYIGLRTSSIIPLPRCLLDFQCVHQTQYPN